MIRASSFAVVLAVATSACFASRSDFERLQQDVAGVRVSMSAADSIQRAQLLEVSRSLRSLTDSISSLSRRMSAMRASSESELAAIKQDISQLQDLSGQSEQRLREMRATLEERSRPPETAPPADGTPPPASGASSGPGPAQLLQAGRDQLLKGGNAAARSAFNELIARYPNSELAPEAMFFTAQAFAAEKRPVAADSVYVVLIARYPSSPRIPTALYKRAVQLQSERKTTQARQLYQEIIRRFPRSDEAALADERLQSIR